MEAVKEAVEAAGGKDYSLARKEMASYISQNIRCRSFSLRFHMKFRKISINFRVRVMQRQQSESAIIRIVSVGVPCEYGKENTVDWEANPTYNGYKEWTWQFKPSQ